MKKALTLCLLALVVSACGSTPGTAVNSSPSATTSPTASSTAPKTYVPITIPANFDVKFARLARPGVWFSQVNGIALYTKAEEIMDLRPESQRRPKSLFLRGGRVLVVQPRNV